MSSIQLQTSQGTKTINFTGNPPTPADIDQIAQQNGWSVPTSSPPTQSPNQSPAQQPSKNFLQKTGDFLAGALPALGPVGALASLAPSINKQNTTNALPAIGSTVGAIGGAALGGLAAGPSVFGIPAGAYAGGVAGSAAGGAAGEAAKEKIQGQALSPGQITKTGAGFGALEAAAGPLFSLAGKGLEAAGEGLAKMFIPKSDAEAGMLQAYKIAQPLGERIKSILGLSSEAKPPTTGASAAFDKGLWGTKTGLGIQAGKAQNELWDKLIGPALKQSDVKVDIPAFLDSIGQTITQEISDLTRQKVLLNALDSIKEDFGNIGKVSLEQLQKFKEGWAEFVPEKAYKGQPIAGALNDVRNKLAGAARQIIYDALGDNVKQAYLDYSSLYGIKQLGQTAMKQALPIVGGTGTTAKGLLEMTTIPISTIGGQTIYKVGQVAEILGNPGARVLRNLLFDPVFSPNGQSVTPIQTPSTSAQSTPQTLQ